MAGDDVHALVGQAVGRLRLTDRQEPVPGEDDLGRDAGIDGLRGEGEGIDVAQHLRDRLGRDEAEFLRFRHMPGDDAGNIDRLIDIAEIGMRVERIALLPEAAAMHERDPAVGLGGAQHVGIEITEGGGEDERGAVEMDHAFHGVRARHCLEHACLLDDMHARHLAYRGRPFGVRLIVAVVGLRADIDEADGVFGRSGSGCDGRGGGAAEEGGAARQTHAVHGWSSPSLRSGRLPQRRPLRGGQANFMPF